MQRNSQCLADWKVFFEELDIKIRQILQILINFAHFRLFYFSTCTAALDNIQEILCVFFSFNVRWAFLVFGKISEKNSKQDTNKCLPPTESQVLHYHIDLNISNDDTLVLTAGH